jgi:RNA polymerase sigma-70 factor (ECF subfamily)
MSGVDDTTGRWDVTTEAGVLACYDATFPAMYRYAARLVGGRAAAEDLTQDAYVRLVRAARAGTISDIGAGWLITTLRRLWIDGARSERGEQTRLRLVASNPTPEPSASGYDRLLIRLTDRERAALVFRYVDDLPVTEVADLLGASVRATESLLQRAKRKARGAASA